MVEKGELQREGRNSRRTDSGDGWEGKWGRAKAEGRIAGLCRLVDGSLGWAGAGAGALPGGAGAPGRGGRLQTLRHGRALTISAG